MNIKVFLGNARYVTSKLEKLAVDHPAWTAKRSSCTGNVRLEDENGTHCGYVDIVNGEVSIEGGVIDL